MTLALDGLSIAEELRLEPVRAAEGEPALALLVGRIVLAVAIPAEGGGGGETAVPSYVVDYSVEALAAQLY